MNPTLSILICTIEGRENMLNSLMFTLARQMRDYNLKNDIEILLSKDKRGEHTIGYKRNSLLQSCSGDWAAFIDDDDMVSDDYLPLIINKLKTENPDVVALEGVITTNGLNAKTFIHSIKYNSVFEQSGIYYRPPLHLNPIRTKISRQFRFPEINHGEDVEWGMSIMRSGLLKTEANVGKAYYFYNFISNKQI